MAKDLPPSAAQVEICFPFLLFAENIAFYGLWILNPARSSALALGNPALFGQDVLPPGT